MDALVMCGGRGTRFGADVEKPLFAVGGEPMVDRVLAALAGSRVETTYAAVSPNAPVTREHLRETEASRPETGVGAVELVETAGDGYVSDLTDVLDHPAVEPPVLTVAADLPLLEAAVVDRLLDAYDHRRSAVGAGTGARSQAGAGAAAGAGAGTGAPSMTVGVPVALKRRLGVAVESRLPERPAVAPTGVNVVGSAVSNVDTDADTDSDTHEHEATCAEPKRRQVTHVSYHQPLAINVNRPEDARVAETLLAERDDEETKTAENEEGDRCA